MVEFDSEMTENDQMWKPDRRETYKDVEQRVSAFSAWIVSRKEDNMVVLSHGVWIEVCLEICCPGTLGGRRVYNCDAYACEIVSRDGQFVRMDNVKQIFGQYRRETATKF